MHMMDQEDKEVSSAAVDIEWPPQHSQETFNAFVESPRNSGIMDNKCPKPHWSLRDVDEVYWSIPPVIWDSEDELDFLDPVPKKLSGQESPNVNVTFEEYLKLQIERQQYHEESQPSHVDVALPDSTATTPPSLLTQTQNEMLLVPLTAPARDTVKNIFSRQKEVKEQPYFPSPLPSDNNVNENCQPGLFVPLLHDDESNPFKDIKIPHLDNNALASNSNISKESFHDDQLTQMIVQAFANAGLQSGITVYELLEPFTVTSPTVQQQRIIKSLKTNLETAFQIICSFQNGTEDVFNQELFFENEVELNKIFRRNREELMNKFKSCLGPFYTALGNKLMELETEYLKINGRIREREHETSDQAMMYAENTYKSQVLKRGVISSIADLQQLHANVSSSILKAFAYAYGYENSKVSKMLVSNLNGRLMTAFEQIKNEFERKWKEEEKERLADALVKKFADEFKKELVKEITPLTNADQFKKLQETNYMQCQKKFAESCKFEGRVRMKCLSKLKAEIAKISAECESKVESMRHHQGSSKTVWSSSPGAVLGPSGPLPNNHSVLTSNGSSSVMNMKEVISTPVGIHFGLDFLSVATFNNGTYRKLYGPCPNNIAFGNEIRLGVPKEEKLYENLIALKSAFNYKCINTEHGPGQKYRIEQIVALILSKVHQIVKSILHTSAISYIISLPTFFNSVMRGAMLDAVQIAGLDGIIVRESCALLCKYIHNGSLSPYEKYATNRHQFLVAIQDSNGNDCDVATYQLQDKKNINLCQIHTTSSSSSLWMPWLGTVPGLKVALDEMTYKSSCLAVILVSEKSFHERNTRIIRDEMSPKLGLVKVDNLYEIVEGTALLAAHRSDPYFKMEWSRKYPGLETLLNSSANMLDHHQHFIKNRIRHEGTRLAPEDLVSWSDSIVKRVEEDAQKLEEVKDYGKRLGVELSKDIVSFSNVKERKKFSNSISQVLREIEAETISSFVIKGKLEILNDIKRRLANDVKPMECDSD